MEKHPQKEGNKLLDDARKRGWKVSKGKKYFKMYCPCELRHKETVHLTPHQDYFKKKRFHLRATTCWKEN